LGLVVLDSLNQQPLIGALVAVDGKGVGVISLDGTLSTQVNEGDHQLSVQYLGYAPINKSFSISAGGDLELRFFMAPQNQFLDLITVSGSRKGREIQKESVSIDVLSSDLIQNNALTDATAALAKVPGVVMLDNQVNIRGGSGYAYGTGSRVMLVIDDIPLQNLERMDVPWDFIPIENTKQIEVLKGASSMQYGSSALNGVVNVTTDWADSKEPETEIVVHHKTYFAPPDTLYKWWGDSGYFKSPNTIGLYGSHKRKLKKGKDLVISGFFNYGQSYLREEKTRQARVSVKYRHIAEKVEGLTYGISATNYYKNNKFFFLWEDNEDGAYVASQFLTQRFNYFMVDPWLRYYDKKGGVHALTTRYFFSKDIYATSQPINHSIYTDYTYRRNFKGFIDLTTGLSNNHFIVKATELGGEFKGDIVGMHAGLDFNLEQLTISMGGRYEFFRLDTSTVSSKPVFSVGLNYQFKDRNYLRMHVGQAFRVPSVAERYVDEQLGDIRVYPNPDIQPESGFSAELGYKRNFGFGKWKAYFDGALFYTSYENMVEFSFGQWGNPITEPMLGTGFKAVNVSEARILGIETSLYSEGQINEHMPLNILMGYTYLYPGDLSQENGDPSQGNAGVFLSRFFQAFANPSQEVIDGMLAYRNRHILKVDVQSGYKQFNYGFALNYYAFMDRVDQVFEDFIPGVADYRADHSKGDVVLDLRAGYRFRELVTLDLVLGNVFNMDYAIRLAKPNSPRSLTIQARLNF
jgi:iron complex outermembrane receptor protein